MWSNRFSTQSCRLRHDLFGRRGRVPNRLSTGSTYKPRPERMSFPAREKTRQGLIDRRPSTQVQEALGLRGAPSAKVDA